MANTASDNRSLHELAVDIVQDIGLLATGLAHVGAPPQITDQLAGPAKLFAGVSKALASGPVGAQPVGGQPGAGPGGAPAPAPAASASPQAPQAPPQNTINGSSPQGAAYGDLHNTIAQMHHDSVNAAVKAGR